MIHTTNIIMLVVAVVLGAWDVYAMLNGVPGDTISERIRAWNVESGGLIAMVIIALWIHWFLPPFWK